MPASLESANIGAIAMGVLLTLLAMSVASVAIAIDRAWALRRAIRDSRTFAREVHPLIRKGDWARAEGATAGWQARRAPLAQVMAAGLAEWSAWPREDDDRALGAAREAASFAAEMILAEMRRGLSALATIGSTAPFVWAYNTFLGRLDALRVELDRGRFMLLEQLARRA